MRKSGHCGEETERRNWQNPERILAEIGLKFGQIFVDLGCGTGFFSIPAARVVGESGMVYALDADSYALSVLRKTAADESLNNIETKLGKAEETVLCEQCADIVFFGIVLHDFFNPPKVLINAKRMLKPAGRLVDLDWKKEQMSFGPPLDIRFSTEDALKLIEDAGFDVLTLKQNEPYHYLIVAQWV